MCVETRQMSVLATEDICPVSAADICPVSTADICPVSAEDIYPVSTADIWRLWGHLGVDEIDFDPFFIPKMRKMEFSWNTTGADRGRLGETGADRRSPRIRVRCQAPQNRPSPSTRKRQDDGSKTNSLKSH